MLSHPESEPEIMMLILQKKKLRLREAKSLPASSASGQHWSQEAGPGLWWNKPGPSTASPPASMEKDAAPKPPRMLELLESLERTQHNVPVPSLARWKLDPA